MIALSLMMLAGYGGMVSLAQISVAGVAGYFGRDLRLEQFRANVHGFGWPFWVVVPFATVLIAAIVSALIGMDLRTAREGIYTIMITLAIATAISTISRNRTIRHVQRIPGLYRHPRAGILGRRLARARLPFYYLCLGVADARLCRPCSTPRARPIGLTLQADPRQSATHAGDRLST